MRRRAFEAIDRSLARRPPLPFRSVNRRSDPTYDPGLQRHHLLPRQLLSRRCFGRFFDAVGVKQVGFDDFRSNGLMLPATEDRAWQFGMPLHRGPHRYYNAMVIERVGCIEARWAEATAQDPGEALEEALMRLALLQSALRRRLLDERRRMVLNRNDPLGTGFDFTELDAMAEMLWNAT
ncbi:AHH domain-containing protein [Altererythrobacter sp. BO-6]|uniref:AHH domain-containing protein n=1 Tax=Altererythrobacter sp. BO-6 TaxID=2604537 RepID=UPI001F49A93A|nr:AHH domain-containing protein [Altererythrobacter sp. BO-6]